MAIDPHKDFGPQALQQLDITEILKVILSQMQSISSALGEHERDQVSVTSRLDSLDEKISDIKKLLTNHITDPRDGVISKVEIHDRYISQLQKEEIIEKVKSMKSYLGGTQKALWVVFAGLVSLAFRVLFY